MQWRHLREVLADIGDLICSEYKDYLTADGKIASGGLLESVNYRIDYDNRSISLSLSLADYWKYVENGRLPGKFPPPDKILEWIRIKPIVPDERNGKLPTEKQLAFLIGRKIAEEGIEAGNQLRNTLEDLNNTISERIEEAITKDIKEGLVLIFSEF